MPNEDKKDTRRDSKGGDSMMPRAWVVWIAILGLILVIALVRDKTQPKVAPLTHLQFVQLVESNLIVQGSIINYNPQSPDLREISGNYLAANSSGNPRK